MTSDELRESAKKYAGAMLDEHGEMSLVVAKLVSLSLTVAVARLLIARGMPRPLVMASIARDDEAERQHVEAAVSAMPQAQA